VVFIQCTPGSGGCVFSFWATLRRPSPGFACISANTSVFVTVDLIVIHGGRLAEYCKALLPFKLDFRDLEFMIVNYQHVHQLYQQPGRRYLGIDGSWAAIVKLQATWKMRYEVNRYREIMESKRAIRTIMGFRRNCLQRAKFYTIFQVRSRIVLSHGVSLLSMRNKPTLIPASVLRNHSLSMFRIVAS
jgi:hypothetical protein